MLRRALLLLPLILHAQTPSTSRPAFEVASIKLDTNCNGNRGGGMPTPGRLTLPCMQLRQLIGLAYGAVSAKGTINSRMIEVTGGPGWLDSDRYTISAKAEGNAPVGDMIRDMMPALLEERFRLKVHKEAKETNIYAVTVAKNGPKLQPMKEGSCIPIDINNLPKAPAPGETPPRMCGAGSMRGSAAGFVVDWYGSTLEEFFGRGLMGRVDRPVVDKTGLTGRYDIHIEFARDNGMSGAVRLNGAEAAPLPEAPDSGGPSIYTALQQQLGLKLVPEKGSVNVLIVDHVERPSDN